MKTNKYIEKLKISTYFRILLLIKISVSEYIYISPCASAAPRIFYKDLLVCGEKFVISCKYCLTTILSTTMG